MRLPLLILFVTITLSCQGQKSSDDILWIGRTNLMGRPSLVEIHVDSKDGSGSISIYGEAVRSYDVAILRKQALPTFRLRKDTMSFTFSWRGILYSFRGRAYGDVLSGSLFSEKGNSEMNMYQTERNNQSLENYYGLYRLENDTCLITKREYGGLRMINLTTGISTTLLEIREGHFTTGDMMIAKGVPEVAIRFPKDQQKRIIGLLEDRSEGQVFGDKLGKITQRDIRYQGFNAVLEGTLFSPAGVEVKGTLILVHGSGPIYRTALVEAAIQFTTIGYSAFIYDKRGAGASSGSGEGDDFDLLARDAIATLQMVRGLEGSGIVGFQGHSQAGYIIPLAIAMGADPDFTIIVNGGAITPGEQTIYDKTNDMLRAGYNQREIDEAVSILRGVHDYVINKSSDKSTLEKAFLEAQHKSWFDVLDLPRMPAIPTWDNPPKELLEFHEELTFDPMTNQQKIKCPTLVILGENDQTVPATVVQELWQASGINDLEIVTLEELGHDMRVQSATGRKFAVEFINTEKNWLNRIVN